MRIVASPLELHYAGTGRGWYVVTPDEYGRKIVVSGPWTSKAAAQAAADARAAA